MATPEPYSPLHRILHWTTALIATVLVPLGFYMVSRYFATDFDAVTTQLFDIHKLLGLTVLALVGWRLGLRFVVGVPAPVATLAAWQQRSSAAVHWALYGLLVIIALLGWIGASAYGLDTLPFGLRLPAVVAKDGDFAGLVLAWHSRAAIALCILAGGHAGMALIHRFVLKDGVMQRMWPSQRS